ncbi:FMN-binding protein [Heyndrickxia acidicola]|uniref:FMN-binding protein n=1 Tax=Heyndrickxia acidicola TaxID=209389 RepID=A0ABU6MJS3_9BACI|nr:FMN-binding protein [Heyndrickxia acidicola]MED1204603.1 FMN-binding protein [Heyndrickxia acidicola]
MTKMSNKMIGLCSAAISAIYITGLVTTQEAQSKAVNQEAGPVSNQLTQHQQYSKPAEQQIKTTGTTPSPKHLIHKQPQSAKSPKIYKNGTYTGSASNRIGSVTVAVTIKQDKITNVAITNCDTHYSEARIDGLPQQVVARQSENVDIVSGATLSSEDFQTAVEQALQSAKV